VVDDADLADVTARVVIDELLQRRRGAHPLGHEGDTVDAEVRVDPGLSGNRTDRRRNERADAADAGHRRRNRNAQHPRAFAPRCDRKGIEFEHGPASFGPCRYSAARCVTRSTSGTAASKARVYSCCGLVKISCAVPLSMTRPRRITATRSLT